MQSDFTPELIRQCQEFYSRESGFDVSPEQADIILTQLAAYGDFIARANGWTDDGPEPQIRHDL